MQSTLLEPLGLVLVSSAARIATGNSGSIKIPLADCYAFVLDVTAVTGTTPTLDVAIQSSYNKGTNFDTSYRFAQAVAAVKRRLNVQAQMGRGEAGTEVAIADIGGALNANTVLTRDIRVLWTIGGTNPSFTFTVRVYCMPRTTGGY